MYKGAVNESLLYLEAGYLVNFSFSLQTFLFTSTLIPHINWPFSYS